MPGEHAPDSGCAWKNRFVFKHPHSNEVLSWICPRPTAWGGPWAVGCWVCNTAFPQRLSTKFARAESVSLCVSAFRNHEMSNEHKAALKVLEDSNRPTHGEDEGAAVSGGVVAGVPRLDRWLHAASVLERNDSFADMKKSVESAAVGSLLGQGDVQNDSSRRACTHMLTCLAEPLRWRDFEVLANATCSSIGIDERDSVLLVYARTYARRTQEVYDCLLGLMRGHGTLPEDCKNGIMNVVRNACTMRRGKDVHVAENVLTRFRESVRSVVADGGPTEQRALFECSRLATQPDAAANPFFPNLLDINRDRAHKWRSIQKSVWKGIDDDLRGFLDDLITGEGSLARTLQTSKKYQLLFQAVKCVSYARNSFHSHVTCCTLCSSRPNRGTTSCGQMSSVS